MHFSLHGPPRCNLGSNWINFVLIELLLFHCCCCCCCCHHHTSSLRELTVVGGHNGKFHYQLRLQVHNNNIRLHICVSGARDRGSWKNPAPKPFIEKMLGRWNHQIINWDAFPLSASSWGCSSVNSIFLHDARHSILVSAASAIKQKKRVSFTTYRERAKNQC